jgi:hypothetical protein
MKIKRTVHPKDKPTNWDEFHAKRMKAHQIKKSNYEFVIGASQSKNIYEPLNK